MSGWSLDLSKYGKASKPSGGRPRPVTRKPVGGNLFSPNALASNWLQRAVVSPKVVKQNPALFGPVMPAAKPKQFKFLDDPLVKQFYAGQLGAKSSLTTRQRLRVYESRIAPTLKAYQDAAQRLNVESQRASKDGVVKPEQFVSPYELAAKEATGWKKDLFAELAKREKLGAQADQFREIGEGRGRIAPKPADTEMDWGDQIAKWSGLDFTTNLWRDIAHAGVVAAGGEREWKQAVRRVNEIKAGGLNVLEQYARVPRGVEGFAIEQVKAAKRGDMSWLVGLPGVKGLKGGFVDNNANYGGGQLLSELGVPKSVAGVPGFAVDVVTDPLTYVSGGTSAVAKASGRAGALKVAGNVGIRAAMDASRARALERAAVLTRQAQAGIDDALERKLSNVERDLANRGEKLSGERRDKLVGRANREKERVAQRIQQRELESVGLGDVGPGGKFKSNRPFEFPLARTAAAAATDAAYTRAAWKSPVTRVTYGGKLVGGAKNDLFGLKDGARGVSARSGLVDVLEKAGVSVPLAEERVAAKVAADTERLGAETRTALDRETVRAANELDAEINRLTNRIKRNEAVIANPAEALKGVTSDAAGVRQGLKRHRRELKANTAELKTAQRELRQLYRRNPIPDRFSDTSIRARNVAAGGIAVVRPASISSHDWEVVKHARAASEAEKTWGRAAANRIANTYARRVRMSQWEDFMHVVEQGDAGQIARMAKSDRQVLQRIRSQVGLRDWDKQLLRQRRRAAQRGAKANGDANWRNAAFDSDVKNLSASERVARDKFVASQQAVFMRDVVGAPSKAEFEERVAKLVPEDQKFARDLRRSLSRSEAKRTQELMNRAAVLRVHEGVMNAVLGDDMNATSVGRKLTPERVDELRLKYGPTSKELKLVREYVATHGAQRATNRLRSGRGEIIEMLPGGRFRVMLDNAPVGSKPVVAKLNGKMDKAFKKLGPGEKVHVAASREGAFELVAADDLSKARLNEGMWSEVAMDVVKRPAFDKLWELSAKDRLTVLDAALAKRLELENPGWAGSRGMAQDTRNLMKYALRSSRAAGVGVLERSQYLPHLDLEHLNETARAELMQRQLARRAKDRAAQYARGRLERVGLVSSRQTEVLAPLDDTRFGRSGDPVEDVFGFTKARKNKGSVSELAREIRTMPYQKRYLGVSVNLPLIIDQYLKAVSHSSAQMKLLENVLRDKRLSQTLVTASTFEQPAASPAAVERARSVGIGHTADFVAARAGVVDEKILWSEVEKALGKKVDFRMVEALRSSVQRGLALEQRLALVEAELGEMAVPSIAEALGNLSPDLALQLNDRVMVELWDRAASMAKLRRQVIEDAHVYDPSAESINDRMMFHGSQSAAFDKKTVRVTGVSSEYGMAGQGLYATSKREVAFSEHGYGRPAGARDVFDGSYIDKDGQLMEGRLNVKNALDLEQSATPELIDMLTSTAREALDAAVAKLNSAEWARGGLDENTLWWAHKNLAANVFLEGQRMLSVYGKTWDSLIAAARLLYKATEKALKEAGGFTDYDIRRISTASRAELFEQFRRTMWDRNKIDAVTHRGQGTFLVRRGGAPSTNFGVHQVVVLLDPQYTKSIKWMKPSDRPTRMKSGDMPGTQSMLDEFSRLQNVSMQERSMAGRKRFVYDTVVRPLANKKTLLQRRVESLQSQVEANLQARSDLLTGKNGLVKGMSAKKQSEFEAALGRYADGVQSGKVEMERQMEEWAARGLPTDRLLRKSDLDRLAKEFDRENVVHADGLKALSDDLQKAGQVQDDALGLLKGSSLLTDPARLATAVRVQALSDRVARIGDEAWFGKAQTAVGEAELNLEKAQVRRALAEREDLMGVVPEEVAREEAAVLSAAQHLDDARESMQIAFREHLVSSLGESSEELDGLLKHIEASLDDPQRQAGALSQWNELNRQYLLSTDALPEFFTRRALNDGGLGLGVQYGFSQEFVRAHRELFLQVGALLEESRVLARDARLVSADKVVDVRSLLNQSMSKRRAAEKLVRDLELELKGGKSVASVRRLGNPYAGDNVAYAVTQARRDLQLKPDELLTDEEFQSAIGGSGGSSLMFLHQPAGGGIPRVLSLTEAQRAITDGQRVERKWARVGSDREIEVARAGIKSAEKKLGVARNELTAILDEVRATQSGADHFAEAVNKETDFQAVRQSLMLQRPLSEAELLNLRDNVRRLMKSSTDWTTMPLSGGQLPHLAKKLAKAQERVAEWTAVVEDARAFQKSLQRYGWRDEYKSSYLTRGKQSRQRWNPDTKEKELVPAGGLGGGKLFAMETPVWEMLLADLAHPHFNGTNAYAKLVNGWKWLVTQAVPAFWVRNMVGDAQNSIMAQGALSYAGNMRDAWRVAKYVRALERSENALNPGRDQAASLDLAQSGSKWIDFKDATAAGRARRFNRLAYGKDTTWGGWSVQDIARWAIEDGVANTGMTGRQWADVIHGADAAVNSKLYRGTLRKRTFQAESDYALDPAAVSKFTGVSERGLMDSLESWSRFRENWGRINTYMGVMQQGAGRGMAARQVAKHHFDYGDLSRYERTLRNYFVPFYTWNSRNTGLWAAALVQRPGIIANFQMARQEAAYMAGMPHNYENDLSLNEQLTFPFPVKIGGQVYLSSMGAGGLPISGINYGPGGFLSSGEGALRIPGVGAPGVDYRAQLQDWLFGMLSPVYKIPIEKVTGYSFYLHSQFAPDYRPLVPAPAWVASMPKSFQTMVGFTDEFYMKKDGQRKNMEKHYAWSADWNYFAEQLPGFVAFASKMVREDEGTAALTRVSRPQKVLSFTLGVRARPWDPQRNMLRMVYKTIAELQNQQSAESKKKIRGFKVSADNPSPAYIVLMRQIKRLEVERTRLEAALKMPITQIPGGGAKPKKAPVNPWVGGMETRGSEAIDPWASSGSSANSQW